MAFRYHSWLLPAAAALACMLVLEGCTKGGQFDPTTLLDNDMFDSKTKLKGQRIPLFPNGVPGTTTGVPADLVKGYQAPPDQTDADAAAGAQSAPPPPAEPAKPEAQPKAKPKPKVAVGRPRPRAAKVEKPPASEPTRIDIGAKGAPAQPPAAQQGGQFAWPAPPQTAPAAPAQQGAQSSPSVWPAPPSTAPTPAGASPSTAPAQSPAASSSAPAVQSGPSFDSMWPKSTGNGTISQ
jgi:hypothetical protein